MTKRPKIASPQGRSVEEWIGATPDAKVPKRVLLRIFDRAHGKCHLSGAKIQPGQPWQAEHIIALADGGEHRESNLAPALVEAHKEKTKREAKERAKVRAIRQAHIGIKDAPARKIKSRGFPEPAKGRHPARALAAGSSEIARRYGAAI